MGREPTGDDLKDAYEQVMLILFRLLFVAYAEDQYLLPYRTNGHYQDHSLRRIALRLTEDRRAARETLDRAATSMWDGVRQLWHAGTAPRREQARQDGYRGHGSETARRERGTAAQAASTATASTE